jgi:Sec-independent protein translocase protein TatA
MADAELLDWIKVLLGALVVVVPAEAAIFNHFANKKLERFRKAINTDVVELTEKIKKQHQEEMETFKDELQRQYLEYNLKYQTTFNETVAGLKQVRDMINDIQIKYDIELEVATQEPNNWLGYLQSNGETSRSMDAFHEYMQCNISIAPEQRIIITGLVTKLYRLQIDTLSSIDIRNSQTDNTDALIDPESHMLKRFRERISEIVSEFTSVYDRYLSTGNNANKLTTLPLSEQ